jgi:hypothetical protein
MLPVSGTKRWTNVHNVSKMYFVEKLGSELYGELTVDEFHNNGKYFCVLLWLSNYGFIHVHFWILGLLLILKCNLQAFNQIFLKIELLGISFPTAYS